MGEVEIIWGCNIYTLHFHYFISLKTEEQPENVNASGDVTCQYPQTY